MPRIQPVRIETAEPKTAELLSGVKKKLGMVPNLISTMALDRLVAAVPSAPAAVATAAASLVHTSVHVVGLGYEAPTTDDRSWLYFADPEVPFYRATNFGKYAAANLPGADDRRYSSWMCEVSSSDARPRAADGRWRGKGHGHRDERKDHRQEKGSLHRRLHRRHPRLLARWLVCVNHPISLDARCNGACRGTAAPVMLETPYMTRHPAVPPVKRKCGGNGKSRAIRHGTCCRLRDCGQRLSHGLSHPLRGLTVSPSSFAGGLPAASPKM